METLHARLSNVAECSKPACHKRIQAETFTGYPCFGIREILPLGLKAGEGLWPTHFLTSAATPFTAMLESTCI